MLDNLEQIRIQNPLVHCITNYVAMNIAANTLLAIGASPAMIHTPEETSEFVQVAGALTINIGTISPQWFQGMKNAVYQANESSIPWVFDPVGHFATSYRSEATAELLALRPTIVRGNASEILALRPDMKQKASAQGIDSKDTVSSAEESARTLAALLKTVVIVTGEIDFITDGTKDVRIKGGSNMMPLVTAMGCSLTCLLGAFVAVSPPMEASVSAVTVFAEAGHRAGEKAQGPGSFLPIFLDELYKITPNELSDSTWIL